MRLQRSDRLQRRWYGLPAEVRSFIESLKTNPRPDGIRRIPERPNYYEEFVAGFWIGWQVDESGSETIIRVTISD